MNESSFGPFKARYYNGVSLAGPRKGRRKLVRTCGYPVPGEHLDFFISVALTPRRL